MNAIKVLFLVAAFSAAAAITSTAHATWRHRTAVTCPNNYCQSSWVCMYMAGVQCSFAGPGQCNDSLCQPD